MNSTYSERSKRLWQDPVIRKKMLDGAAKGAIARRKISSIDEAARRDRIRRFGGRPSLKRPVANTNQWGAGK